MKKTPVFIFYFYLLLLTATGFAQLPGHDVVYKIIPKERVMQLIREQAYPKMAARGINELEINARFSSRLSVLADEVADNFGYEADLKKIQEGDSIALKRHLRGH
ncbi:MAG: hypothetical protein MUE99_10800 [Chitinophagaceae bacterium]|nr:hypothetical protein [Chitinophagaceae bacterium]